MCVIIYGAFVRLRRTEPNVKRGFKIPGGNFVKWLIGIVGIAGAILAAIISFFPPSQINTGSPAVYIIILVACTVVFLAIPFIVYDYRNPTWRDKNTDFLPFNWEIEGRQPGRVSKWPEGYEPTPEEIQRAMEWQDGDFGPVTMKTIGDITNMALKPDISNGSTQLDLTKITAVDVLQDHEAKTMLAASEAMQLAQKAQELAETAAKEAADVNKLAQGLASLVDAETKAHAATAAANAKSMKEVQDKLDPNEPFTSKDIEVHDDDNGAPSVNNSSNSNK